MAYRYLTLEEQYQVSTPWVTVGDPARVAIEKTPLLVPQLPKLQTAHDSIAALRGREDPKQQSIAQLELQVDHRHDTLVSGIYKSLSMLSVLSPAKEELLSLRDWLFPNGLSHTRLSYRGEAGHAALVASHLDDAMTARLKAVNLHDQSLFDLVQQWFAAAKQLGDLEEQKARLAEVPPTMAGEVQAARMAWVRAVKLFVANAEAAELDADTDNLLFSALRAAERAAEARVHTRPAPAPAPAPVPAPAVPFTKEPTPK
jgi:hypothetical protein